MRPTIPLETKLLIVGDSVMGCLSSRRGMVMHLPTRVHILVTALRLGLRPRPLVEKFDPLEFGNLI
jgi:hypothetical protein